jgi:ubiquinol-cytochrome c reductase cytochrome b subunit
LPFLIIGLIIVHLYYLHLAGSSDPILRAEKSDYIPFFSYYYYKDLFGFLFTAFVLVVSVLYYPNLLGHSDNYIEANALVTPQHIVPEWYFLPFYGLLRAIPSKFGGILAMFTAIFCLALFPIFASRNTFHLVSIQSLILYRIALVVFLANFVLLG